MTEYSSQEHNINLYIRHQQQVQLIHCVPEAGAGCVTSGGVLVACRQSSRYPPGPLLSGTWGREWQLCNRGKLSRLNDKEVVYFPLKIP